MNQSKALATIDSLKSRLANLRGKADDAGRDIQRKAVLAGVGFVAGKMQYDQRTSGAQPFSVMGLPTDVSLTAVAFGASMFAGGRIGEIASDAVDAGIVLIANRMGRGETA